MLTSRRQGGHDELHRQLVARALASQEHEPTESGKLPTAPHLLTSGAPRPRHSQGRGIEGLSLGTWVSSMDLDSEGSLTRASHSGQSWPHRRES